MIGEGIITDEAREKDHAARALRDRRRPGAQRTVQSHKTERRRFSRSGDTVCLQWTTREQVRTAYIVQQLRRQRDRDETRIRIDTQRRQQDAVRILAEAAGELVRRLEVEERRNRKNIDPTLMNTELTSLKMTWPEVWVNTFNVLILLLSLVLWWWLQEVFQIGR
ncbi:hypothetical protein BD309DRAFT_959613 [Dichomitus squalens]|uniref:Uncharacterized protein n=1 Tax=Dichomitus squalens TaxID=114155 RepID=A0A4Q9MFH6_9APHY|nr:hypothetical protein BD311DRAFT_764590 [Dichomitus squalens]TBU43848.1 hypothetical protein BD309DRAFT_959613 [Dichomitus squalens]